MRLRQSLLVATCAAVFAAPAFAAKPLKYIGITVGDLANPFFVAIGQGAEASAKKNRGQQCQSHHGFKQVRPEHASGPDRKLYRQQGRHHSGERG